MSERRAKLAVLRLGQGLTQALFLSLTPSSVLSQRGQ